MAIDKSVFDLRRKVPFVQQEKMHARNLVVHGALQCAFYTALRSESQFFEKVALH